MAASAVVVDQRDAIGITHKNILNEQDIEKLTLNCIPLDCCTLFVLRKPGDYCISKDAKDQYYLSILVEKDAKSACTTGGPLNTTQLNNNSNEQTITLKIEQRRDHIGIQGMIFANASTIGELIHLVATNSIDMLSGILERKVMMNRLVAYAAMNVHNIFWSREIAKRVIMSNDHNIVTYTGEMEFFDGRTRRISFIEPSNSVARDEFLAKIFEELRLQNLTNAKKLPIRSPIAAILNPPTLVYPDEQGFGLDYILDSYQHNLDLSQRIKICASCVRIMSEIHNESMFHGGVMAANFYAHLVGERHGVKQLELVFNGSDGLVAKGKCKTIGLVDYDAYAPEVAFTRNLTPESGVFNIGRLFEKVLEPDLAALRKNKNKVEQGVLNEMKKLICQTTLANPIQRPTMHGIVLVTRQVLAILPQTDAKLNFVHFDQFNS